MNNAPEPNGKPDPQLLAAYFDGELEGRDDVADVRARIEGWLETHPEATEEWADHHRLQKAWLDTTPAEPRAAAWRRLAERIDSERRQPAAWPPARRSWLTAGMAAASILLLVGLVFGALRAFLPTSANHGPAVLTSQPKAPDDDDVLQVATASEVTILRIEGADTDAVVVGTFPVSGSVELADSGEVCISCKCPHIGVRQDPSHRPMVWARLDGD